MPDEATALAFWHLWALLRERAADGMECKECGDATTYGNLCPECSYRLDRCTFYLRDGTFADCSMTCRKCLTERYGLHECGNPLDSCGICIMCSD